MTISVTKKAINLREELADLRDQPRYYQHIFWFDADGVNPDFSLPAGWVPLYVFNAGALQKEGSGDEYEVTQAGLVYTVSFNTAPTNGNDVGVPAVREDLA